jgi:hypothetical protein
MFFFYFFFLLLVYNLSYFSFTNVERKNQPKMSEHPKKSKASAVPKRLTKQLHRSRSVDRQKAARKRAIIRLFRKVTVFFL